MTATVLRVSLDRTCACESCPLSYYSEQFPGEIFCNVKKHSDVGDIDPLGPAPSWCPLRTGPVTVEGEK